MADLIKTDHYNDNLVHATDKEPATALEALEQAVAMLNAIRDGKNFGMIHYHEKLTQFEEIIKASRDV